MKCINIKRISAAIIIIMSSYLILANPDISNGAVYSALKFASTSVVPSLFTAMVLSKLALYGGSADLLAPLLMPVSAAARLSRRETSSFLLGNICGFPGGAAAAATVSQDLNLSGVRSATLCAVSNNVSPIFCITFIGNVITGSLKTGIIIYVSQLVSAVTICAAVRRIVGIKPENDRIIQREKARSAIAVFCDAVKESGTSCITVIAFIASFSVIIAFTEKYAYSILAAPLAEILIKGTIEISHGCLAAKGAVSELYAAALSFCTAFSGMCVICQSASFVRASGAKISSFVLLKIAQGILSFVLTYLALSLFMPEHQTEVFLTVNNYSAQSFSIAASASIIALYSAISAYIHIKCIHKRK